MKTDTTTLIAAMYELARTIQSDDGVANAAIFEAAERIGLQQEEIDRLNHDRSRLLELLATIHRDGGQYSAENGIEKACDDAGAQVATWLETINSVDAMCEQARIAERADQMTGGRAGLSAAEAIREEAAKIRIGK